MEWIIRIQQLGRIDINIFYNECLKPRFLIKIIFKTAIELKFSNIRKYTFNFYYQ